MTGPGEFTIAGGPYAPGTYRPAHLLMADCLAGVWAQHASTVPDHCREGVAGKRQADAGLSVTIKDRWDRTTAAQPLGLAFAARIPRYNLQNVRHRTTSSLWNACFAIGGNGLLSPKSCEFQARLPEFVPQFCLQKACVDSDFGVNKLASRAKLTRAVLSLVALKLALAPT